MKAFPVIKISLLKSVLGGKWQLSAHVESVDGVPSKIGRSCPLDESSPEAAAESVSKMVKEIVFEILK